MFVRLLTFILAVSLAATSIVSYADNYDTARKIMQADKEVRDYQAEKAGGHGYISGLTETFGKVGFLTLIVAAIFGGNALYTKRGIRLATPRLQKLLTAQVAQPTNLIKDAEQVKFRDLKLYDSFIWTDREGWECVAVKIRKSVGAYVNKPPRRIVLTAEFNQDGLVFRVSLPDDRV
jgi:hypothetical protein